MVFQASPTPAFGQADLSNCEREQIHLAGSIQPHGALLALSEPDCTVVQMSANAPDFLNLPEDLLGKSLEELDRNLAKQIFAHLGKPLHTIPVALRCQSRDPSVNFDCLLHRPPGGGVVIELERAEPRVSLTDHIENALDTILASSSLESLCDEVAKAMKQLTGYDRVMVYRFDADGHGEVYSEQKEAELESYLGNRYPASDIPQMARRLYERNRVRLLVDVEYEPVPITPRLSPISGQDLDMSICFLRSMSPIHIQYLKNMGVRATLVVSLVVGGTLWGLIACHHYERRLVPYDVRTACELIAEAVATRIAALESFHQSQAEVAVRRLEQRMVDAISREGDWRTSLFDDSQALLRAVESGGAALLFEGQVQTTGEVPGTQQLREIGHWLDHQPRAPVISTAQLESDVPSFTSLKPVASGLLAVPVSAMAGEYLIWFRPERVRTITWGGNPFKPVLIGNDPSDLSPRRSFSQWHQLVEGTSEPWTERDLTAARMIGESLTDVVLQFRAVRMLIAQNQLEKISRRVRGSDPPVIIADGNGRILLTNESFQGLLKASHPHIEHIDNLLRFVTEPASVREVFRSLLEDGRAWRGEIGLENEQGEVKPYRVRADPVFSAPDNLLGVVLLFTDLTERKAAEAARQRFQEDIVAHHRLADLRLDSKADLLYRNLFSSVVGNAQLAALEIADSTDLSRVPGHLKSVRASVERTAELLEHMISHSSGLLDDERE